jgi:hypothetical protein
MKVSDKQESPYTRVLLFGLPGSGKSTLAAKLAEEGFNLIWISLDNDSDVLRKLSQEAQERVEYVDIPDSASYPIAAQTLLLLFKNKRANICWEHGKDQCAICKKNNPEQQTRLDFSALSPKQIVVIDTVTQLGRSVFAYTTKDKPVEYKPERDDWGALRKYTEFFASEFQAFRGNLICITHAIEAEQEDGRTKIVTDFGSKGMSASFGKAFSHIIYMEVVNKKHKAYSASTFSNSVLTRSRTDFRIEDLAVPSLAPVFTHSSTPIASTPTERKEEPTTSEPPPIPTAVESNHTPATKAALDLNALRAKLKGSK